MTRSQIKTDIETVYKECCNQVSSTIMVKGDEEKIKLNCAAMEATGRIIAAIIKSERKEQ